MLPSHTCMLCCCCRCRPHKGLEIRREARHGDNLLARSRHGLNEEGGKDGPQASTVRQVKPTLLVSTFNMYVI